MTHARIIQRLKVSKHFLALALTTDSSDEFMRAISFRKKKRFAKFHKRAEELIIEYLRDATSVVKSPEIHAHVLRTTGLKVSRTTLIKYLKDGLGLQYRVIKPITKKHNAFPNLVARQLAAAKYIEYLADGKRIISVDESVLNATDNRRRSWVGFGVKNIVTDSQRLNQVNMIAAVSSYGEYFLTTNCGKTNGKTFLLFISKLITHLDSKDVNWRANTVIMLDNASYHRSFIIQGQLRTLDLPIMYLGPYQYKVAPVELLFSFLKNRDMNQYCKLPYSKGNAETFLKEIIVQISRLNFKWLQKSFYFILTPALEHLSLTKL